MGLSISYLQGRQSIFYAARMKFAAAVTLTIALLNVGVPTRAQGLQVDVEEARRLQGEIADMRETNLANKKRIDELTRKVDQLQSALREANERNRTVDEPATREDLKRLAEKVAEVDAQREKDRKAILDQFEKLEKGLKEILRSGGGNNGGKSRPREQSSEQSTQETAPEVLEGNFLKHVVQSGETFSEIIEAFNAALKKEGRPTVSYSQVRKANPKLDLNRIRVGQEILLPVPDKK